MADVAEETGRAGRVVLGMIGTCVWTALGGFLGWAVVEFVDDWRYVDVRHGLELGLVLCAICIVVYLVATRALVGEIRARMNRAPDDMPLSRRLRSNELIKPFVKISGAYSDRWWRRSPVGDELAADPEPSERPDATPRVIHRSDVDAWIRATNRLLAAELSADASVDHPKVSVVRVGINGIELLLEVDASHAPPSFCLAGSNRIWQLDPTLELAAIESRVDDNDRCYLPTLVAIGEDNRGVYFTGVAPGASLGITGAQANIMLENIVARWLHAAHDELALYRLGSSDFDGAAALTPVELDAFPIGGSATTDDALCRNESGEPQAVIITQDRGLAELARTRAPDVAIIGAVLAANQVLYCADDTVTIEPLGITISRMTMSEISTIAELSAPTDSTSETDATGFLAGDLVELPTAGRSEVRILREHPDIVGELRCPPTANAVQFVAYLATHDRSVATSRLRDVLGAYRLDDSKTNKTVWNAAGATRQALGNDRVPNASGNQRYAIAEDVTCDWIRFAQISKIGHAAHLAGDAYHAISACTAALELVEGLPGADERRFEWLNEEGFVYEIERQVVEAARLLSSLALANGSPALSQWAMAKGRLVSPEAEELDEVELTLVSTRE